jgi:hypothetical protein
MSHSFGKLRAEDLDLLALLAAAALDDPDSVPFAYRPLAGWPFAWLVHPRLAGGEARVVDLESLARLEEAGCVVFTIDNGEPPSRHAMLTHAGMTRYQGRHGQPDRNQAHDIQSDVATHVGSSLV